MTSAISHYSFVFIIWILCVDTLFAEHAANSLRCSPNVNSPGTTFPRGDIFLEAGSSLNIYCILNSSHTNASSSQLRFVNDTKDVPSEYIKIINETTIKLEIDHMNRSNSMFYCKLQTKDKLIGVCLNKVVVDTQPKEIMDFNCLSYNWVKLNCSWKNPLHYVQTKYSIFFQDRWGKKSSNELYPCPKDNTKDDSCVWDKIIDPYYRQYIKEYRFLLEGFNQFGNWSKHYVFDHWKHVVPGQPSELNVVDRTPHSITISWKPPFEMENFTEKLTYRIDYQHMWDTKKWTSLNISSVAPRNSVHKNLSYIINGLQFANTIYDIRIYIRVQSAPPNVPWSQPSNITVKTLPALPEHPPRTDVGSFEIIEPSSYVRKKRSFYIYWQRIPEFHYNGANFSYLIYSVLDGEEKLVKPDEQTEAYAKFRDMSNEEHRFKIYSSNSEGKSSSSEVIVPQLDKVLPHPLEFTKIAHDKNTYELSWDKPQISGPVDYTLFWCSNDRDTPFQCSGFLNWKHLLDTETNITMPDDKFYQFAISVNNGSASSGMAWSSCTVNNKYSGRMNNVDIEQTGASNIRLSWHLECKDKKGIVKGFVIYYCKVWNLSLDCKEPEKNITINDATIRKFDVDQLSSYTTYKLTVAVLFANGPGEPSDPHSSTTLASAPSQPPEIKSVTNVTNTSALFIWEKPAEEYRNGMIESYKYCLNESLNCPSIPETSSTELNATIDNLEPYTTYRLTIQACTINGCSNFSNGYVFSTRVGIPEKIERPFNRLTKKNNVSSAEITWKSPRNAAGPLHGYQIRINYPSKTVQYVWEYCRSTRCSANILLNHSCEVGKTVSVQVRAYNVLALDDNNQTLFGEWSDEDSQYCSPFPANESYFIIFLAVLCGFFLAVAYFLSKKVYHVLDKEGPEVVIPPGLVPPDITSKDPNKFPSPQWIQSYDGNKKPNISGDSVHKSVDHDHDKDPLIPFIPPRTTNRSESDSEQLSMGSGDTQSSECHNTSGCSENSDDKISNRTPTLPLLTCQAQVGGLTQDKSANTILPESKPSGSSYVILGENNTFVHPSNLVNNVDGSKDLISSLEDLSSDLLLSSDILSALEDDKNLQVLKYCGSDQYQKISSFSNSLHQPQRPTNFCPVPSMKDLITSTTRTNNYQTVVATASPSRGYQPLPVSSNLKEKSSPSSATSPVMSIVINKTPSGYVTVSSATAEPSNVNSV